jgi:lipopolysaccharide/colanic/teichoic acid biosynthesis glycosyltransferase
MSFVGPKPERPYLVNRFVNQIPAYVERFSVRPGLIGLAQIKSGSGYSVNEIIEKLDYDLVYCKNRSLKFYFSIIFSTLIQSLIARR